MRRLKSIDIFRGLCMMWLFTGHILNWWLRLDDVWFYFSIFFFIDFIGASGFLFVSGISTSLSYNNRKIKAKTSEDYNEKMLRNEYLLRVLFLFIVSILFNIVFGWFWYNKLINIWRWYILLTITFSLLLAWPLLKISKLFRIFIGICIWIFNIFLKEFLLPHEGELNFYGILFYILYHKLRDDPILVFFTFFLIGTVFGDIIFEIIQIENKNERLIILKRKMIFPSLIMAPILITIGVLFKFPEFFVLRGSFSWSIYVLGLDIILITILLSIEEYEIVKTEKSYRFLFYFSYYSLSIFIFHYPLALLFYHKISLYSILFYIVLTIIIVGLFMRFLYKRVEGKYSILNWKITFSVKVLVNRMSQNIVRKKRN